LRQANFLIRDSLPISPGLPHPRRQRLGFSSCSVTPRLRLTFHFVFRSRSLSFFASGSDFPDEALVLRDLFVTHLSVGGILILSFLLCRLFFFTHRRFPIGPASLLWSSRGLLSGGNGLHHLSAGFRPLSMQADVDSAFLSAALPPWRSGRKTDGSRGVMVFFFWIFTSTCRVASPPPKCLAVANTDGAHCEIDVLYFCVFLRTQTGMISMSF